MATKTMPITGNPDADKLLMKDPLALLVGMLLNQQVPMEWAFMGPFTLQERLGGALDAAAIADMPVDDLVTLFATKPGLHRYPKSMAERTHALCEFIAEHYDNDAGKIWRKENDATVVFARLRELPGYGEMKAKIFMAILAKRLGVKPTGWEKACAPYSDDNPRSVADVDSPGAVEHVREFKKAAKAKAKAKAASN